jgi:thiosulfate reductase cytochrome b subunit
MVVERVRSGLPRVPGGKPWPPVSMAPALTVEPPADSKAVKKTDSQFNQRPETALTPTAGPIKSPTAAIPTGGGAPLRRGLPRLVGGEPWPEKGAAPISATAPWSSAEDPSAPSPQEIIENESLVDPPADVSAVSQTPLLSTAAEMAPRPRRSFAELPKLGRILITVAGSLVTSGLIILLARWLLGTPALQTFVTEYPGETALPDVAPLGLPAWLGWQHFFNVFLMVLIIRSGLNVRREKRPAAYWASKRTPQRKISLTLWFHQALDILWLMNGAVYVLLLVVTGQWMRIVPMSWEVFPNALSALLQYASFNWPTENGWVNYNSLQVLAYFVTVFVAAPLAALTGMRMSGLWPNRAKRLNAVFPMELARALHFPTMVYFCGFIVIHVVLVFTTGILRNLNHMYGAQDSSEWTGFWIFAGSMAVISTAWVLARPLVLATIGRLFGSVTAR